MRARPGASGDGEDAHHRQPDRSPARPGPERPGHQPHHQGPARAARSRGGEAPASERERAGERPREPQPARGLGLHHHRSPHHGKPQEARRRGGAARRPAQGAPRPAAQAPPGAVRRPGGRVPGSGLPQDQALPVRRRAQGGRRGAGARLDPRSRPGRRGAAAAGGGDQGAVREHGGPERRGRGGAGPASSRGEDAALTGRVRAGGPGTRSALEREAELPQGAVEGAPRRDRNCGAGQGALEGVEGSRGAHPGAALEHLRGGGRQGRGNAAGRMGRAAGDDRSATAGNGAREGERPQARSQAHREHSPGAAAAGGRRDSRPLQAGEDPGEAGLADPWLVEALREREPGRLGRAEDRRSLPRAARPDRPRDHAAGSRGTMGPPDGSPSRPRLGGALGKAPRGCGAVRQGDSPVPCVARRRVEPLERQLEEDGFVWREFLAEQPGGGSTEGQLQRLKEVVGVRLAEAFKTRKDMARFGQVAARFEALQSALTLPQDGPPAPVLARLSRAVERQATKDYREAYQRLAELDRQRKTATTRRELLASLQAAAPAWAQAIQERRAPHDQSSPPGDAQAAWLWRQLHDELERRGKTSLPALQAQIDQLGPELRKVTAELIERRAWGAQVRRTTSQQQQSLVGWLDMVRRIGKGMGKRVPRLIVEARQKMTECRSAVPVWIMPLAQAVETFEPTTRFDVVITDEASQADVMALIPFYMARRVVVVGDHEQVSPSAVGQDLAVVQQLIDEHLEDIPNSVLYDGQMSVYDLARQSFGGAICLTEHFRCVPEIIEFS